MDWLTIILFSIGLAMDCFAVSLAKGIEYSTYVSADVRHWHLPLLMAILFGLFQGGMPLIGYLAGSVFVSFVSRYSSWIALLLLSCIGGRMIWESLAKKTNDNPTTEHSAKGGSVDMSVKTLLILAIATSIDALATGVVFVPYPDWIWLGAGVIAFGSFVLSLIGWWIGCLMGTRFRLKADLIGGIILVGIGLKIWIESLWF
ncbi:MAG: manganese efflux pump [Paludibacteraceae bacterium]|nr:manganese efflux pump [Paludibacteraceae bacterium]